MSDNDSISRRALYEKIVKLETQAMQMTELHLHDDDNREWLKWAIVLAERIAFRYDVANAPSVPHEMSAKELLHIELRMFGKYLEAWSEYSDYVVDGKVEEAIAFAERWAREHPEEANDE